MTPILVDSSVLLDVITEDPTWGEWSADTLQQLAEEAVLVINPLIYAEVSIRYETIEELEAVLPIDLYRREPLPWEAAFLAGKAFLEYRRRGGVKRAPLPDFYTCAHAAVRRYRLLTRDPSPCRPHFPTVSLIAPGRLVGEEPEAE
ncbi:MAG: type II toxin-antitoxin system VapC family toxin [Thermoanaerobaculia bacterium]